MTTTQTALATVCVLGIAAGQILFKLAADSLSSAGGVTMARGLVVSPYFLLALALYGAMTLLWIWLLQSIPLSRAYPFFALSFVFVPIFGRIFLAESIGTATALGAVLIVAGIAVGASSVGS